MTFICDYSWIWRFEFTCNENTTDQFITLDEGTCSDYETFSNCDNINVVDESNLYLSDIDDESSYWINLVMDMLNEFEYTYGLECDDNNNSEVVNYDIDFQIPVCCRGSESWLYTDGVYTNLASIYYVADFSCGNVGLIWTGDYVTSLGQNNIVDRVTIYCMAHDACFGSDLESADRIICGANSACGNVDVESGQVLCVIEEKDDIIICSAGLLTMNVTLH